MNIPSTKTKTLIILLLVLGIRSYAQESTLSSGKSVKNESGSVSYSIGQTSFSAYKGSNGSVTQGVQQVYTIEIIDGLSVEDIYLTVYPNPTTDLLMLEVEEFSPKKINYMLFNMDGKLIDSNELKNQKTEIDMRNLVSAIYFLSITDNNKIKTFKIIKE